MTHLRIKIKGADWFEPDLNMHSLLSPHSPRFFYMPLFNSVAKRKLFLSIKLTGGGAFVSPPPKLCLC